MTRLRRKIIFIFSYQHPLPRYGGNGPDVPAAVQANESGVLDDGEEQDAAEEFYEQGDSDEDSDWVRVSCGVHWLA